MFTAQEYNQTSDLNFILQNPQLNQFFNKFLLDSNNISDFNLMNAYNLINTGSLNPTTRNLLVGLGAPTDDKGMLNYVTSQIGSLGKHIPQFQKYLKKYSVINGIDDRYINRLGPQFQVYDDIMY